MASASATRAPRAAAPLADATSFPAGAFVAVALLAGSWSWWAIKQGAYFPTVFNPGIVLLCAGLVLLLASAPWRARLALSRPSRLAVLGLAGLAAWTFASALWSPSPDVSISDAQRVLAYLVAFALGAWLCNMLGRRMELSLAPVVVAAGIVGGVAIVELLVSKDFGKMLELDGTLQYPLGYRNANAAFFAIAIWPCLALASHGALDRRLRLLAALVATTSVQLAALSQSRASIGAAVVGLLVFLVASRKRPRALAWALLAAVPLIWMVPLASDLFESANQSATGLVSAASVDPMHAAGTGMLGAIAAVGLIGLLLLALEERLPARVFPSRRSALIATGVVVVLGLAAFTAKVGNPGTWLGDRYDEFAAGEADLSGNSSRFTLDLGSNREDVWRVALDGLKADPLFGDGSGGFQYRYLRERHLTSQVARDAHSVELEMLSELGLPGFAFLVLILGGATAGILRARRLGPNAIVLSSGALAAGAYWLAHSSVDWFWSYPAVTAPVFGLLGAACAPTMLELGRSAWHRRTRFGIGACAIVLALSVVPALFASRYLDNASGEFRTDLPEAYSDIDKAKSLEPLSDEPLLIEGAIAQRAGNPAKAISAFQAAIRKRPEEWAGHYFLAQIYAKDQPRQALSELSAVSDLNPLSDLIGPLRKKIERGR